MTIKEVKEIIRGHIARCDHTIEEIRASIRESYARMQTNVDARRDAIKRYEERKPAFQTILDEIGDDPCSVAGPITQEEEKA